MFQRVKEKLAGLSMGGVSLKTAWEGVTRAVAVEDVAAGIRR